MDSKKRPPFFLALQELKEAEAALAVIRHLIESQQVDDAVGAYPHNERGWRIGEIIGKMRMTSASVLQLCESVADHTDLPAVKKILDRP